MTGTKGALESRRVWRVESKQGALGGRSVRSFSMSTCNDRTEQARQLGPEHHRPKTAL